MKAAFYNLGCKVNSYELQAIEFVFRTNGFDVVDFNSVADVYVINTCSVTNQSDVKSRKVIRACKRRNDSACVAVMGCYSQLNSEKCKEIGADIVLGTNNRNKLPDMVFEFLENKKKQILITPSKEIKEYEKMEATEFEHTRAFLKIQDGCNNFCSYCIIPYARGRIRSRKPESIIEEVKKISEIGLKEIVLTGIHIASYGKDFKTEYGLIDLLEDLNKIDGIERIRLGSIEPLLMSKEFIQRLSKLEKICHHFHLSLQSGCTETLKRMNRRYTAEEFEEVVNRLRNTYEDVILTTDIIVGFPLETDEEFNITYEFLKKIKFYKMHVFKYSPRTGTKAAAIKEQIPGDIKEKRSKVLLELSDINEEEYLKNYIGKIVDVLFEEKDEEGYYKGHTANYIMVKAKSDRDVSGEILKVNVTENLKTEIIGKIM